MEVLSDITIPWSYFVDHMRRFEQSSRKPSPLPDALVDMATKSGKKFYN